MRADICPECGHKMKVTGPETRRDIEHNITVRQTVYRCLPCWKMYLKMEKVND